VTAGGGPRRHGARGVAASGEGLAYRAVDRIHWTGAPQGDIALDAVGELERGTRHDLGYQAHGGDPHGKRLGPPVMAEAARTLESLGVPYELEVTSAHRLPSAPRRSFGAPRRAASGCSWSGRGARPTWRESWPPTPRFRCSACPLASSELLGLDALLATVQMPAGIPVGTLAVGKAGAPTPRSSPRRSSRSRPGARRAAGRRARDMAAKVEARSREARKKLPSLLGGGRERSGYHTVTLGCKLNRFDSAAVEAELERRGYSREARLAAATVVVVNTCT